MHTLNYAFNFRNIAESLNKEDMKNNTIIYLSGIITLEED